MKTLKPYWKTPSHIIAFSLMVATQVALFATFFTVIGIGIAARNAGDTSWQPSQAQTMTVVSLLFIAVFVLVYFIADLAAYLSKKKANGQVPEPMMERPAKETASVEEKKPADKSGALWIVPSAKNGIEYSTVFKAFVRCSWIYVAALGVLTLALVWVTVYYFLNPVALSIRVTMIVALCLALGGHVFIFLMPSRIQKKLEQSKSVKLYEDHIQGFAISEDGSKIEERYEVAYGLVRVLLEAKDAIVLRSIKDGRKMLLFLRKDGAPEEAIPYLKEHCE
ncbi:MAG: hypothetical protein E7182_05105 [Erysipelotrichaceae bacterium]|nr:hypothetical protein [Erysipelotrichaceae bacterium]